MVAAAVGGLRTAVADGVSGVLVAGHDPQAYADALPAWLIDQARRASASAAARWRTPPGSAGPRPRPTMLEVYRAAATIEADGPSRAVSR